MAKIILPKKQPRSMDGPLIFLAGPIRGASDWHSEAARILISLEPDVVIVSPRRTIASDLKKYLVGDEMFQRQRAWERHYLDCASKFGTILFWLPGETEHNCKKSYGAMTRLELGQALTHYAHDKSYSFCLGSDGNFSELTTINYDISLDAPDKELFGTLEKTCQEALRLARK